jgi:cystathionine beta-lyase/cystathionine gamma-synthase
MTIKKFDPITVWDSLSKETQNRIGAAGIAAAFGVMMDGRRDGDEVWFASAHYEGANIVLEELAENGHVDLFDDDFDPNAIPDLTAFGIEQCRVCGCTETVTCENSCSWSEPNLCSNCTDKT